MPIGHAKIAQAKLIAAASIWTALRRWGGPGLLLIGVIDSSLIPTLGSLDIFNAVLAARHRDLWWYYALMSTAGSAVGAFVTYRLAAKAPTGWLQKKIGEQRIARIHCILRRWGVAALLISVVAPPPFPSSAFFVAAGALQFPVRRYLAAVIGGRALRYGLVAWIASHYSRRVIRFFRHPEQYAPITIGLTLLLILFAITAAVIWHHTELEIQRTRQQRNERQQAHTL